jgi:uncharacterized membrane protein
VLIHFPIALFITGVVFDSLAQWTTRWTKQFTKPLKIADAAYYNFIVAALSTLPVLATGILAWQMQLEGRRLKGILLLHLLFASASSVTILLVWWIHSRSRRHATGLPTYRLPIEFLGVALIAVTGHLGGFLSGVNAPG